MGLFAFPGLQRYRAFLNLNTICSPSSWKKRSFPVTVDKSHLVTIGERLYAESIELIRELVNNAYDADATEVKVTVTPDSVSVEDNGTGMDLEGLQQYFVIGSQERSSAPSRRFSSAIGSASSVLASSPRSPPANALPSTLKKKILPRGWFLTKKHGRRRWVNGAFPWDNLSPDPQRANGTTVTLQGLTKQFLPEDVERKIIEGVPLKAPHFAVFLNRNQLHPRVFPAIGFRSGRNRIWAGFGRDHYSSRFRLFRR